MGKDDPVDVIIHELQRMLRAETIKPGGKIPSERMLAERLKTSRGYVRKALQKLEFYGVLEIRPQKGIYLSGMRPIALDALITNIRNFDAFALEDLIETRSYLEIFSARLAAERGDSEDHTRIAQANEDFQQAFKLKRSTLEEDHLFHLAIVKASKNKVLESLITQITPEIIAMNKNFKEDQNLVFKSSLHEHEDVLKNILNRNPAGAAAAMENHMKQSRIRRLDPGSPT
ncbi:FadR/GntR family transcriptional regulator [Marispirochaeta aestuarii]|uniref:FadR/GntR family transcriptional regulator n=1 Tax=Marispirochaeta aestuarii TaxID=1963862 RepID=UPI0029C84846|nr:FadR/GntR family transcriptional regulator [Marispirochaeta aestuarii]